MNKSTLALLLFVLVGNFLSAQTRSFGEFNMIPKSLSARSAAKKAIKTGPFYEEAVKVYDRLVQARGDFRYPVPEFAMTIDTLGVANIKYGDPIRIFLSEKAFKVCKEFGAQSDAAMAFLLGHELTHYYEKHAWRSNFASDNADLKISKELESLFNDLDKSTANGKLHQRLLRFDTLSHQFEEVAMEAQSDYLGGFLAYTAGYGNFDKGPELINRLYQAYGLPEESPGYITKTEREDLSRRSAERMKDLVDVFDMANLLAAIGQYDEAYQFYRTLLEEYQSREVYNNVGTTAMLQALKLFTPSELEFRYPIQLDLEMAQGRGEDEVAKRNKLLLQAIQQFEAAISLDHDYAPAYVNKACALALMGDTTRARFYADVEARKVATGKYAKALNDIEILLGILDAGTQTKAGKAKAKARFTAVAALENGGLAAYNLAIMNKATPSAPPEAPAPPSEEEMIDGMQVYLEGKPTANKKIISVGPELQFMRDSNKGPNAQFFGVGKITMLITNPNYPLKTARGIGINASRTDIEKAYGVAPRSIRTPNGEILAYDDERAILFMLKGNTPKDEKLERWVLYKN